MNPRDFTPKSITLNTEQIDQNDIDLLHNRLNFARYHKISELPVHIQHTLTDLVIAYNASVESLMPEEPTDVGTLLMAQREYKNVDTFVLTRKSSGTHEWIDTFYQRPVTWNHIVTHYDHLEVKYAPNGDGGVIDNTPPNDPATLEERASNAEISQTSSMTVEELIDHLGTFDPAMPVLIQAKAYGSKILYTDAISYAQENIVMHSVEAGRIYATVEPEADSYENALIIAPA